MTERSCLLEPYAPSCRGPRRIERYGNRGTTPGCGHHHAVSAASDVHFGGIHAKLAEHIAQVGDGLPIDTDLASQLVRSELSCYLRRVSGSRRIERDITSLPPAPSALDVCKERTITDF